MSFWNRLLGKPTPLTGELEALIRSTLASAYIDPYFGEDLNAAGAIPDIVKSQQTVQIGIRLNYPAKLHQQKIHAALNPVLADLFANSAPLNAAKLTGYELKFFSEIPAHKGQRQEASRVKNIIAVASGKGGVGKSTTTVNLALALAAEGAQVAILDADLYGPSQPKLLGIPEGTTPATRDMRYYAPITAHGIKMMSMGVMVSENTPLMWRGPVASETLQQLILQTLWGDLDYLLIDMPPGTGDIHITMAQSLAIAGAVIVTTPQDIALLDARKGIEMFQKVDIPVLGIIENMASHHCSACGYTDDIFGTDGGTTLAREWHTELLGSLPLDYKVRERSDSGLPMVISEPESEITKHYHDIALRLAANVARPDWVTPLPNISFVDD